MQLWEFLQFLTLLFLSVNEGIACLTFRYENIITSTQILLYSDHPIPKFLNFQI